MNVAYLFYKIFFKSRNSLFTIHHSLFTIAHSLQIIPGIPLSRPDILTHIPPESQHHINDNRRPHRKNRGIHKILPDPAGGDAHPVAYGRTNAKSIPLNKVFKPIHSPNLVYYYKTNKKALFTPCFS